ncbi:AHH domain-containing protein [Myxococcus sp. AB025B]|uniref:AHH domain-containing protein n=1 Tax=Myxococcus sp. AB025B TaxID=2562794 RepID=UPI0034CEA5D7
MRGSKGQNHHLATNKNDVSAVRGGPWTPRFRKLFARAGMKLEDPENIIEVVGHKGPHPQPYHEFVLARLTQGLGSCTKVAECRKALTQELRALAREAATRGTEINRLLTRRR